MVLIASTTAWPDTYRARVEMLALIETLDAGILGSPSATATLEAWCADHARAAPATINARIVAGPEKPASHEQRERLGVDASEPIKHRYVALSCGPHILSVADNWYVPGRLTPAMNVALASTDVPFGRIVAPLEPRRRTIAAIRLWTPLPTGRDQGEPTPDHPDRTLKIPDFLLEHRAILYTADRTPFAEVHEHYTSEILNFGRHASGAATAR